MGKILISGGLIPTTPNTLVDAREKVSTFAKIADIENPALYMVITVEDTGKKYEVKKLTSKVIGGIVVQNAAIDINDPEALLDLGLAEEQRAEDERVRQANEDNRIEAENLRQSAEDSRNANETNRVSAESARDAAERARENSEEVRNSSEQTRISNESKRQSQESTRQNQESSRVNAENIRKESESARGKAELKRNENESSRISAELVREQEEGIRSRSEQNRVSAENTRSSAEDRRVSNENQRLSNESARNEAETSREQAEGNRASTFNTLKGELETTIQQGQEANTLSEAATQRANEAAQTIEEWESVVVTVEDEGDVNDPESDIVNEAIRKTPQTLTKAEQMQARTNIGAASLEENAAFKTEMIESNEAFKTETNTKLSEIGSNVYNISFINLAQWGTGLTESLAEGEWGYNTTNKKVYYKRNGILESMEMDSNVVYKYGEEFFKWDGTTLLSWDILSVRRLLINSDGMSWEDYPSLGGTVNTSSIGSPTGGSHKVIGVKGGQKIVVKGSPNGANYYVFVKSIDLFEPTFDLVDSITGRVTISANASKTIDVPADANYFVICHYYGDSDRSPQSLSIDGFDLIKGAKSYISDFSASITNPEKKVVDLAGTLKMEYYNTNNGAGGKAQIMSSDTLGSVLVRIKEGDFIETNSELASSSVRQWCIMKDDLTIVRVMPKFEEYTVSASDIQSGGTLITIPCRVTEQVAPLYVRRTRIIGNKSYGNKTVVLLGDSQIGQCQGLEDVIEENIGNTVINAGFGGCRWSWRTTSGTSDWDKFCAIGVADAIISGDFAPLYDAVDRLAESGSSVKYFKRALDGLSSLDFGIGENIILVIAYGGNDHSSSTALGDTDSIDKETLYGAMNYVIDSLVKTYPMIDIRVLCPTYVAYTYEKDENNRKVVTEDSDVRKIGGYTRQEYAELLLEHAKRKKVPTYDMYNRGGRNKDNIYILTPDGIHPNTELGVKHTANRYRRILSSF